MYLKYICDKCGTTFYDEEECVDHEKDCNCINTSLFDPDMIAITKDEYERLLEDSSLLNALKAVGVDNWNGYGKAWVMHLTYEEE